MPINTPAQGPPRSQPDAQPGAGTDARPVAAGPGIRDYLLLITLAAMFGTSFMFTSISVAEIAPLSVVAARLFIALLLMYPLMRLAGQKLPPLGRMWVFILASAFFGNALPFSLISWGQVQVDAGLTSIFMAVMPLATLLLAHLVTSDEKLNRWKLAGVLCGLLGVVILMGWQALNELGEQTLRQLAILGGALCYAVNAIITRQLTGAPRKSMIVALLLCGSGLMVPAALLIEQPWQSVPSWPAAASVVALALGPTALATLMILVIIDRQGASFLSQINFLVPVFGVFFGVLLLNETLPANAWLALAVILSGVAISRRRRI